MILSTELDQMWHGHTEGLTELGALMLDGAEKTMQSTMEQHEADYNPEIWRQCTLAELGNWVHLLAKRSAHRDNEAKRKKDLEDARNYLSMMDAQLSELEQAAK